MVKKNNEQPKWMTPTQLSKVFLTKFDSQSLINLTKSVAKYSYYDRLTNELKDFLSKYKAEDRERHPDSKDFFEMLETLQYAIEHPDTPEAQTFLNSFKFLSQLRYYIDFGGSNIHTQSFMSQLDKIVTDGDVKCGLLLKMSDIVFRSGKPTDKILIDLLTKNAEHVSTADWKNLISTLHGGWIQDINLMWTLMEQMEISLAKDIQAELQKVPYDIQVLEKLSANITEVTRQVSNAIRGRYDQQQIQERLNSIQKKYQLENILSKEIEQIGELPKTGYVKANELEQEAQRLRQQIAQLESQKRELEQQVQGKDKTIDKINQELAATKQSLNETLEANQNLHQENKRLSQAKANSETKLQELIKGARQIKSGLGCGGVNNYKQMVEEIEASIIR